MGRDWERVEEEVVDWTEFEKWAKASESGPPPLSSVDERLIEYVAWPPTWIDRLEGFIRKIMKKES